MFATRVVFAGSRSLRPEYRTLVGQVVTACIEAGAIQFSVGCAQGADAAALTALLAAQQAPFVSVFAVGSQRGEGFPTPYTPSLLRNAEAAGCKVTWLAGGELEKLLTKRLFSRTAQCVRSVAGRPGGVLCAFFGAGRSSGTVFACKVARSCGLTVVAFNCGSELPSLPGGGRWVAAPVPFNGGVVWQPNERRTRQRRIKPRIVKIRPETPDRQTT